MKTDHSSLPKGDALKNLLSLSSQVDLSQRMEQVLLSGARNVLSRQSKKIRAQMVQFGYLIGAAKPESELSPREVELCQAGAEVIEALHAGSLIVDDIQDGSKVRRGQPTLHLQIGLPLAINTGNWLYFWPMEIIRSLGLETLTELELYRACHRTLLRAHFGQALDIGTRIDQVDLHELKSVCLASLELKTGALMALAIEIGSILAGAPAEIREASYRFGHEFGIALQMFDDLGNTVFRDVASAEHQKQLEDLLLKRPSWVWAVVGELGTEAHEEFKAAVHALPELAKYQEFFQRHEVRAKGKHAAVIHLGQSFEEFENVLGNRVQRNFQTLNALRALGERMANAYD